MSISSYHNRLRTLAEDAARIQRRIADTVNVILLNTSEVRERFYVEFAESFEV